MKRCNTLPPVKTELVFQYNIFNFLRQLTELHSTVKSLVKLLFIQYVVCSYLCSNNLGLK